MASILTNTASMAALQTLRSISNNMETTQDRISSGLRVGTASDNAAYWSIATTMRSDNAALGAVQDALGLGAAKIDTAYAGMESAIDVVKEIKNKLITAQESTADKGKIQEEITQLQDQLKSITDSASFSGENWLKGSIAKGDDTDADLLSTISNINKQIVGSFTRDSSGNVKVQSVGVTLNDTNVLFDTSGENQGLLDLNAMKATVAKVGDSYYDTANVDAADLFEGENGVWTNADGDEWYLKAGEGKFVALDTADPTDITGTALTLKSEVFATGTGVSTSVSKLDITDMAGLKSALGLDADATDADALGYLLSNVDAQLEGMTSAAAALGAVSSRIDLQNEFVSKLSDSLERGIGRLVDADMNEESTRLKALQTQQQLAIQALSIANSDSQNILSLFR